MTFAMNGLDIKRGSRMTFVVFAILILAMTTEASRKFKFIKSHVAPCNEGTCGDYCKIRFGLRPVTFNCSKRDTRICIYRLYMDLQVEKYNKWNLIRPLRVFTFLWINVWNKSLIFYFANFSSFFRDISILMWLEFPFLSQEVLRWYGEFWAIWWLRRVSISDP